MKKVILAVVIGLTVIPVPDLTVLSRTRPGRIQIQSERCRAEQERCVGRCNADRARTLADLQRRRDQTISRLASA
jgi:hypothetical protein